MPLVGHSQDGIGLYVEGDKILFAGDSVMPLPYVFWGDRVVLQETLRMIKDMNLENIVQVTARSCSREKSTRRWIRRCIISTVFSIK